MLRWLLIVPITTYRIVSGIFYILINICRYFYLGIKYTLLLPLSLLNGSPLEGNNEFERLRKFRNKEQKILKEQYNKLQKYDKKPAKVKKEINSKDKFVSANYSKGAIINEKIDLALGFIIGIPNKIKEKFNNNEFVKHSRNQNMMRREALLINFDGQDAEKSDKKVIYRYEAKNPEGQNVVDYFEAYSKVEVHSFLLSEGYEVYKIETNKFIQLMHKNANVNKTKFKNKDLIFFLTQLSTYIKAGIPLIEALRILEKQYKTRKYRKYRKILNEIVYSLTMGENFSDALTKQNVAFPKLLINMVKTAEMTGELPEVLDDQAEYYTQTEKIHKQMVSALMYPCIVLTASIAVAIFIMLYVVPQFVEIYESMDASQIPGFTLAVLAISDFLKSYWIFILLGIFVIIILFIYGYKNVKSFRTACQYFVMKLPIFGNTVIYNEVAMFTKTFSSLLSHNVFITDSMEVLNKMTNNEIYKMIILDTITNLAKGDKISEAFKDNWAFPIPAYEMLVTGEKTGELPEMMAKVSAYYQELHSDNVQRIKTVAEPAITVFLTAIVGILIMAIIVPMFGMYATVQNM